MQPPSPSPRSPLRRLALGAVAGALLTPAVALGAAGTLGTTGGVNVPATPHIAAASCANQRPWTCARGQVVTSAGDEMPGVNDKGEAVKGVWDGVTDTLFSSHKAIGLTIFTLMLLRLAYRLMNGAPKSDPTVPKPLTGISHGVHWLLYLLLIAVPIVGYIGISYGNYLDVFGIHLPAITAEDKKMSEQVFEYHGLAAQVLLILAGLHIGGALYHKVIRKDRVVERMLPKKTRVA